LNLSKPILSLAVLVATIPVHAGLIGYYTFEGNANDVSGNGNHGTLSANAPVLTASGGGFTGWGDPNSRAYTFGAGSFPGDPLNSFITVPININPTALPQVTFGAWVKASDLSVVRRGIISHDNVNFDRTIDLDERGPSANVQFCMFRGASGNGVYCGDDATTGWTFLVARYDAATSTAQFTVNGVHSAVFAATNGPGLNNTTIGRNPNFDLPFVGQIDNVFFYDQYLSDAQVSNIYLNGIPEPSTFFLMAGGFALLAAGRLRRRG
jgi:hypothetical protein